MPFEQSIGAFKEHFERWLMEAKGFSRSDIKDAECKIGPYPVDWNGFKHGNIFLIGDALPSFSPFADWGIYPAIKSGDLVTKAILGMPYKKDLKRVYKRYKLGIPVGSLFLKDLLENKFSPNSGRIMKKLSSSRSGHLTLSYIGKILARFYKYAPSVTLGYVFNLTFTHPTYRFFDVIFKYLSLLRR
jgi:flavin-dependent dehydrogenase